MDSTHTTGKRQQCEKQSSANILRNVLTIGLVHFIGLVAKVDGARVVFRVKLCQTTVREAPVYHRRQY